jgi:hypothetical protein
VLYQEGQSVTMFENKLKHKQASPILTEFIVPHTVDESKALLEQLDVDYPDVDVRVFNADDCLYRFYLAYLKHLSKINRENPSMTPNWNLVGRLYRHGSEETRIVLEHIEVDARQDSPPRFSAFHIGLSVAIGLGMWLTRMAESVVSAILIMLVTGIWVFVLWLLLTPSQKSAQEVDSEIVRLLKEVLR